MPLKPSLYKIEKEEAEEEELQVTFLLNELGSALMFIGKFDSRSFCAKMTVLGPYSITHINY